MARKSAASFDGDILHFGATRMRVFGSGNLQLQLISLDPSLFQTLTPVPMAAVTSLEPIILSNFQNQRAQLMGFVSNIDENFTISKIVVYVRPVSAEFPQ